VKEVKMMICSSIYIQLDHIRTILVLRDILLKFGEHCFCALKRAAGIDAIIL
jgi:hypothetical protein